MAFEIKTDENGDKYLEDVDTNIIFRVNKTRLRGRGAPDIFDIVTLDGIIELDAFSDLIQNDDGSSEVIWHVDRLFVPAKLLITNEEAFSIVANALKAYKFNFNDRFSVKEIFPNSQNYDNYIL
ncbi:MAG: hypothetical protein KDI13_00905 [Alphaproteobacteria bacterium]|nr:hypothetical protein [Alphaproteobacteria bacterium]